MATTLAEAVKPKYGGIFSTVMHYGGNILAVSGFSFFGGNVNVNSKISGNCGCLASYMHMFLAPEQTANLFPTVILVHTL